MEILPVAILLGIIGGMAGALFINVNTRVNALRKNYLKTKWIKPLETFGFCFATATFYYYISYFMETCKNEENDYGEFEKTLSGWCPDDQFSPVASYYFGGQGSVIANMMSSKIRLTLG
jgi:hypothetical protein